MAKEEVGVAKEKVGEAKEKVGEAKEKVGEAKEKVGEAKEKVGEAKEKVVVASHNSQTQTVRPNLSKKRLPSTRLLSPGLQIVLPSLKRELIL